MKRDTCIDHPWVVCVDTSGGVVLVIDLDHLSGSISANKHSTVAVKINHSVHGYHRVSIDMRFDNLAWLREFGAIASRAIAITRLVSDSACTCDWLSKIVDLQGRRSNHVYVPFALPCQANFHGDAPKTRGYDLRTISELLRKLVDGTRGSSCAGSLNPPKFINSK